MRRVGKGFSEVETPLFATMLVHPQAQDAEEEEEDDIPTAPTPPSPTPPLQDHILMPPQAHPATTSSPSQEQPTKTSESSMPLLNTLLETYATLKRVKKLKKKKRSKSLGLMRLRKGRKDDDNAATKDANAAEPTALDDEEVIMTMAQTLIKMKDEKVKLLNEQMAQRLHDEEVERATAKEKKEKEDLERAKVLQQQYEDKEENIDWNIKNMVGYKMEHFRGMTYDRVRSIFEREYKKLQTLFKPDKDVEEPTKKRVAEETLLQESFKKLKVVEVSEAYQSFEDMPKGFNKQDLVALWRLVKEKFSSAVPNVDKEKALWVELKRLFEPDVDDVLWKLQRVVTLMLSVKLQVDEDYKMARDLVMKISMKANKPKRRTGVDVVQRKSTKGLMLLSKADIDVEETEEITLSS
uniref:Uncharacterized protein n=1 Tax=Tanacetum cinerariifolium TaxID=118510 RepID=A0A6L2NKG7_TANCI|nr:hypothetical protein [Tanacetum cinerariifolium]